MLDGIADIAREVQVCRQSGLMLPMHTMLEDLRATCSPLRVQELLSRQAAATTAANRHRATRLLRKAAIAAKIGNVARCQMLQEEALKAVDGDQDEVAAIIEEHRFSFFAATLVEPSSRRVRMGFAR